MQTNECAISLWLLPSCLLVNIPHAAMNQQEHFLAQGWLVPRLKLEKQTDWNVQGIRKYTSRGSEVKVRAKENYNAQDV